MPTPGGPDEFGRLVQSIAAGTTEGDNSPVVRLGWVEAEPGCHTTQLTLLAKPNGTKGRLYLAAIQPFRHALIYPAMLRTIEQSWAAQHEGRRP